MSSKQFSVERDREIYLRVPDEIGEDIKAITNTKGTANFMIKIGSLEIPFQKNLSF